MEGNNTIEAGNEGLANEPGKIRLFCEKCQKPVTDSFKHIEESHADEVHCKDSYILFEEAWIVELTPEEKEIWDTADYAENIMEDMSPQEEARVHDLETHDPAENERPEEAEEDVAAEPDDLDKDAWVAAGRPRCSMCGRGLSDPVSIKRGVGSECWKKYNGGHRTERARRIAAASWVRDSSEEDLTDAGLSVPKAKKQFADSILKKLEKAQPLSKKQRSNVDKMITHHMLSRFHALKTEAPDSLLIVIESEVHVDTVVTTVFGDGTGKVKGFSLGWD